MLCNFSRRTPRELHHGGRNQMRAFFFFLLLSSLSQSFGFISDAVSSAGNAVSEAVNAAVSEAENTASDGGNAVSDAGNAVSDAGNVAVETAIDAGKESTTIAGNAAESVTNTIGGISGGCAKDSQCANGEFCNLLVEGIPNPFGTCTNKYADNQQCEQAAWPSRQGVDSSCRSDDCVALLRIAPTENVAYCRPENGFGQNMPCTEDSDCSNEGSGLWCKGGGALALGTCEPCPAECEGGCHACNNNLDDMKCGRSSDSEKFDCAVDVVANAAIDFITCVTMIDDLSLKFGGCIDFIHETEGINGNTTVCSFLQFGGSPKDWNYSTTLSMNFTHFTELTLSDELFKDTREFERPLAKKKEMIQKVFMANGIPVIIEMEVQPFIWFSTTLEEEFEATLRIGGSAEGELKLDLDIDKAILAVQEGGPDNQQPIIIDKIIQSSQYFGGVLRIGPRITVSVNKVPMEIDIAARFGASVEKEDVIKDDACISGSVKLNNGLDVRTALEITPYNPFHLAKYACEFSVEIMGDVQKFFADGLSCVGVGADLPFDELSEEVESLMEDICKTAIDKLTPDGMFNCNIAGSQLRGARVAKKILRSKSWSNLLLSEVEINSGLCDDTGFEFLVDTEATGIEDIGACDAGALFEDIFDDGSAPVWEPISQPSDEIYTGLVGYGDLAPSSEPTWDRFDEIYTGLVGYGDSAPTSGPTLDPTSGPTVEPFDEIFTGLLGERVFVPP